MSSNFDTARRNDLAALISADGERAEAVTYRPRNGSDRPIYAWVIRRPPATPEELQQGITPSMVIIVQNSSSTGISLAELDTGGDAIVIKPRLGGADAAVAILLPEPAAQDVAAITFRIGKR